MSGRDRDKWNTRYRQGAYANRPHASAFVLEQVPAILATQQAASGDGHLLRALDLACGAGRNAMYLAGLGYDVDAVDISTEALARGRDWARQRGHAIHWMEHDLDLGLPRGLNHYDLIVIVRYLDLSLVAAAADRLRPGGYLVCETHLASDAPVIGPRGDAFRAQPGELRHAAAELDVATYWEGELQDPDGRTAALARLVAWRPYDPV